MLKAAINLEPGLKTRIEAFLETQRNLSSKRKQELTLSMESVKHRDLPFFVSAYGSIQLAFNEAMPSSRVILSRKTLSVSLYMHNASELLRRVIKQDKNCDQKYSIKALSKLIDVNRKTNLPHRLWSSYQDAALVFAILKHGWLDQEVAVNNIAKDTSILWGDPFDGKNLDRKSPRALAEKKLVYVSGKHAAELLNKEDAVIANLKGFDRDRLVKSYGLIQSKEHPRVWQSGEMPEVDKDDGFFDLPPKKDLSRRAKNILARTPKEIATNQEADEYAVLDHSAAHTLLEELLRALLKESSTKISRALYDIAVDEVGRLALACEYLSSNQDIKEMQTTYKQISKQLTFAKLHTAKSKSQAKNIVRVTLGDAISKSRRDGESALPVLSVTAKATKVTKSKATSPNHRISSKTMGEKAVESARKNLFETFDRANPEPRSDSRLFLTEVETLIVTIAISYGLPVWVGRWKDLIEGRTGTSETLSFGWSDFHGRLVELAQTKLDECKKRFNKLEKEGRGSTSVAKGSPEDLQALDMRRESAASELSSSMSALDQIEDYRTELDNLAKKTTMLLAKIHEMMVIPGEPIKNQCDTPNKDIYTWMKGELRRWADSFGLIGDNGHTLAYTAVEFLNEVPEEERVTIEISTVFEKVNCYHVISQISSLTRIRAFLHGNQDAGALGHHLDGKVNGNDTWAKKPSDWSPAADVALLFRLSAFGFTAPLLSSDESPSSSASVPSFTSMKLSKGQLQYRADQLALELHKKCNVLQERKNDEVETIDDSPPQKRKSVEDTHTYSKKKPCPSP